MTEAEYLDGTGARQEAIGIARDAIAHLSKEKKTVALDSITKALQTWKLEQAAEDGTIQVSFSCFGAAVAGDLTSRGIRTERVPATELLPEQLAGPLVRSACDLFVELLSRNNPTVEGIENAWGLNVITAILLERDGMRMPMGSILFAVRTLWIYQWEKGKAYQEMAGKAKRETVERLARGRTKSGAMRTTAAKEKWHDWRQRCERIRREYPKLKRIAVAAMIHEEVKDDKNRPSIATIDNKLKGYFR